MSYEPDHLVRSALRAFHARKIGLTEKTRRRYNMRILNQVPKDLKLSEANLEDFEHCDPTSVYHPLVKILTILGSEGGDPTFLPENVVVQSFLKGEPPPRNEGSKVPDEFASLHAPSLVPFLEPTKLTGKGFDYSRTAGMTCLRGLELKPRSKFLMDGGVLTLKFHAPKGECNLGACIWRAACSSSGEAIFQRERWVRLTPEEIREAVRRKAANETPREIEKLPFPEKTEGKSPRTLKHFATRRFVPICADPHSTYTTEILSEVDCELCLKLLAAGTTLKTPPKAESWEEAEKQPNEEKRAPVLGVRTVTDAPARSTKASWKAAERATAPSSAFENPPAFEHQFIDFLARFASEETRVGEKTCELIAALGEEASSYSIRSCPFPEGKAQEAWVEGWLIGKRRFGSRRFGGEEE